MPAVARCSSTPVMRRQLRSSFKCEYQSVGRALSGYVKSLDGLFLGIHYDFDVMELNDDKGTSSDQGQGSRIRGPRRSLHAERS